MTGELNNMSGDKWHRTEEGKLSFKNKMKGVTPFKNKTQEEKYGKMSKKDKNAENGPDIDEKGQI